MATEVKVTVLLEQIVTFMSWSANAMTAIPTKQHLKCIHDLLACIPSFYSQEFLDVIVNKLCTLAHTRTHLV